MQNKYTAIVTALLVMMIVSSPAMGATYTDQVDLVEKNSTWQPVPGGASATVEYNASGDEFVWHAVGTVPNFAGPQAECYALIYYADRDDRFVNWDGSNPGACIGMFQVDACSGDFDSGDQTTDLGINLPEFPDFNGNPEPWNEYCGINETYDHCCGAKLWIVPCSDYDAPAMTAWNPEDYLFETDLIWYDDTDYNVEPSIETTVNVSCVEAGDTVLIGGIVNDGDGEYDLENMIVTANMSIYGVEDIVTLDYIGMIDCISANYSASVTVTTSTIDECPNERERYMGTSFDIYAEDPSGANDTSREGLEVKPGPCAYMKFHNNCDYDGDEELTTVALTQLTQCDTKDYPKWWSHSDKFGIYMIRYTIHLYDEYDNHISCINRAECCDGFDAAVSGTDASLKYDEGERSRIIMINENNPGETTVTVNCLYGDVPSISQTVEFLNPIASIDVTADVDEVYAPDTCNYVDAFNVTAQIVDLYGDPIPMPGVEVILYIDNVPEDDSKTDENGTVIFEVEFGPPEEGSVTFRCWSECREGSLTLEVVDPVLYCVEFERYWSPMESDDDPQCLTYTCYTNHDTLMCCPTCPPATWTATLGEIDEDGCFTAGENEGVAEITVNVSGVIGTAEIVIDAESNCSEEGSIIANEEFTLTSGTVSITGNYSGDNGYACVQAMGTYDPGCDNATKYAWVYVNEDVILDLNGTGDMWMWNRSTEVWEFYAAGDTAEVEGDDWYALVTEVEAEPEPEPDPDPTPTATYRRSSGGSGGGMYPPVTPDPDDNTTTIEDVPEDKTPEDKTPEASGKPASDGDKGGVTVEDTPTPTPTNAPNPLPGFAAIFAIAGFLGIAYLIGRKR